MKTPGRGVAGQPGSCVAEPGPVEQARQAVLQLVDVLDRGGTERGLIEDHQVASRGLVTRQQDSDLPGQRLISGTEHAGNARSLLQQPAQLPELAALLRHLVALDEDHSRGEDAGRETRLGGGRGRPDRVAVGQGLHERDPQAEPKQWQCRQRQSERAADDDDGRQATTTRDDAADRTTARADRRRITDDGRRRSRSGGPEHPSSEHGHSRRDQRHGHDQGDDDREDEGRTQGSEEGRTGRKERRRPRGDGQARHSHDGPEPRGGRPHGILHVGGLLELVSQGREEEDDVVRHDPQQHGDDHR